MSHFNNIDQSRSLMAVAQNRFSNIMIYRFIRIENNNKITKSAST